MDILKTIIDHFGASNCIVEKTESSVSIEIKSNDEEFDLIEEIEPIKNQIGDEFIIDTSFETDEDFPIFYTIEHIENVFLITKIEVFSSLLTFKKFKISDLLTFYITILRIPNSYLTFEKLKSWGITKTPLDLLREYFIENEIKVDKENIFREFDAEGYRITYIELNEEKTIRYPSIDSDLERFLDDDKPFEQFQEPIFYSEWLNCLEGIKNNSNPVYWYSE